MSKGRRGGTSKAHVTSQLPPSPPSQKAPFGLIYFPIIEFYSHATEQTLAPLYNMGCLGLRVEWAKRENRALLHIRARSCSTGHKSINIKHCIIKKSAKIPQNTRESLKMFTQRLNIFREPNSCTLLTKKNKKTQESLFSDALIGQNVLKN